MTEQALAGTRVGRQAGKQAVSSDKGRIWIWAFLAVIVLSQLYFVRELLAAFALFAIGFLAIALVVATLCLLQKSWELGIARLGALRQPILNMASVSKLTAVRTIGSVGREGRKAA